MKSVALIALSLAAGAGAFSLMRWVYPTAAQTQSLGSVPRGVQNNPQAGMDELQAQVRRLALEVGALSLQVQSAPKAPPATIEKESAPPDQIPSSETRARARQEHEERIADLEAAFRDEGHDPTWSTPTEENIRDAVTGANLTHSDLQEVQCRSTTCRVELTVQDPVAFSREMPNLISRLSEHLRGSVMNFVDNSQGGHTGILYVFR